jgi:putative nucleotidyltransferase with HDIG domain
MERMVVMRSEFRGGTRLSSLVVSWNWQDGAAMEKVSSQLKDVRPEEVVAGTFVPISLESICTDTVTNFKIYVLTESGKEPVLYRAENLQFTERVKKRLLEHDVERVYIQGTDQDKYQEYVEQNLDRIVRDDRIQTRAKAQIVYSSATFLMEKLFKKPRLGKNIRRCEQLVRNTVGFVLRDEKAFRSLLAVTSYDYYTYTHSINVHVFSVALAQKLGLGSMSDLVVLGTGALLHDIGKSIIDRSIIAKRGLLNDKEWTIIKKHPVYGTQILRETGGIPEECYAIVSQHHERCDGSGYPEGLTADKIHNYAKVSAIADVFDAMTTQRVYRDAAGSFTALQMMKNEMCTGLDQDIFREFVQLMGQ